MRFQRRAATPKSSNERDLAATFLWYVVPTLVAAVALSYFALALAWRINPPMIAVQGTSMEPTLRTGDLVFLERPNVNRLRVGDIIAVRVPRLDQQQYGLPPSVVHRIVEVKNGTTGHFFVTRGDHNPGPDLFNTQPNMIIGQLRGEVPFAGYPFLFLENRDGKIFLGGLFAVGVLYLIVSAYEERRAQSHTAVLAMQAVLLEAERLANLNATSSAPAPVDPRNTNATRGVASSPDTSGPSEVVAPEAPTTPANSELELLARETKRLRRRR